MGPPSRGILVKDLALNELWRIIQGEAARDFFTKPRHKRAVIIISGRCKRRNRMRTTAKGVWPIAVKNMQQRGKDQAGFGCFGTMFQEKPTRQEDLTKRLTIEVIAEGPIEAYVFGA